VFVIIILVVVYLRRALKAKLFHPEWHDKLQWLLFASIGLLVAQAVTDHFKIALDWVGMIMLGWLLYILSTDEKFKESRFLVLDPRSSWMILSGRQATNMEKRIR